MCRYHWTLFFKFVMHMWEIRVEGYETPYNITREWALGIIFGVCPGHYGISRALLTFLMIKTADAFTFIYSPFPIL